MLGEPLADASGHEDAFVRTGERTAALFAVMSIDAGTVALAKDAFDLAARAPSSATLLLHAVHDALSSEPSAPGVCRVATAAAAVISTDGVVTGAWAGDCVIAIRVNAVLVAQSEPDTASVDLGQGAHIELTTMSIGQTTGLACRELRVETRPGDAVEVYVATRSAADVLAQRPPATPMIGRVAVYRSARDEGTRGSGHA